MKGVIMQIEGDKAVVLYNNGTFGVIRAPEGCEVGMGISVTSNKKMIVLLALSLCAVCALLFLLAQVFYVTPIGYVQITTGATGAALEVSYNRMERIHALRPLNIQAVSIAAGLAIVHKPIPQAWGAIIAALDTAGYLSGNIEVLIAQDDLANAKGIQADLVSLSESMKKTLYPALALDFSLYTIELYQKAMTGRVEAEETPGMPGMGETHHGGEWMERRGMMNRGGMMDGGWCW